MAVIPPLPRNDSDAQLVAMAKAGSQEAFAELAHRTSPAARRLAISILRDTENAADAVQDAYVKAWEHLAGFQGESKFSTWFSRIVFNQCLMSMRSARRSRLTSLDQPNPDSDRPTYQHAADTPDPESSLAFSEAAGAVRAQVDRLPRLLRDPLQLRDLEELPLEEVAGRLGVSIPALKSRLQRARLELKQRLVRQYGLSENNSLLAALPK